MSIEMEVEKMKYIQKKLIRMNGVLGLEFNMRLTVRIAFEKLHIEFYVIWRCC